MYNAQSGQVVINAVLIAACNILVSGHPFSRVNPTDYNRASRGEPTSGSGGDVSLTASNFTFMEEFAALLTPLSLPAGERHLFLNA